MNRLAVVNALTVVDLHNLTIAELSALLARGECTSEALTERLLGRIHDLDRSLNSFISVTEDQALHAARQADQRIHQAQAGPLMGIPLVHKDIFCTDGIKTSCGSRILDNFIAPYDATVVERLREAGMVLLGKTNMDEFAMGSSNETSVYGPVRNPWDLGRVPGGSSGGSAAAVAARLAPAATGTDTGGSIRQPAALCGITGLKPTYGRVSRFGMIAFASSLDQGGPLARTAYDCALLLEAMAGFDPRDSTSIDQPVPPFARMLDEPSAGARPLAGLRIGLPREFFQTGLDSKVASTIHEAIGVLRELGCAIREVSLPNSALAVPVYYVVAPAECSSNLARYDGVRFGYRCQHPQSLEDLYLRSRGEGFGPEVKRRIMIGTYVLSAGYFDAYYLKAQRVRRLIRDDFVRLFETVDVIAGPTSPTTAFKLGEKADDPLKMYLSDIYTIPANLAGLPALSMPAGLADGLPVGLQLIGNVFDEARLLKVAHQFQQATAWHLQAPPGFV